MKRRAFLSALPLIPLACRTGLLANPARAETASPREATGFPRWRSFEITTRVTLPGGSGAAGVWLPLAQSAGDYQLALDLRWTGNGTIEQVRDQRYGSPILRASWDGGEKSTPRTLEVVQIVNTRDRGTSALLPLTEAERKFWTASTEHAPADGVVLKTAAELTATKTNPREQLRAIYDWVIDHTYRDPDVPGCGTGDFARSLVSGRLGGKCADINSLLVGLARAAGFPAREVYGLRVAGSNVYPSLGRTGDVSRAQHCRAEAFLDDAGWFPLDPADVRKAVLEQRITLDSAEGRELRERMFGRWEMNWVGYNSATDLILPGSGGRKPDFCFLMYPWGFNEAGDLPTLDPARFRYQIQARELAG